MSIHTSIADALFPTPLLELQAAGPGTPRVILKAEYLAPLGNLEDRWALIFKESADGSGERDEPEDFTSPEFFAAHNSEAAIVVAAFNHANRTTTTEAIHIAVGCRFFNNKQNLNPFFI
ncbi:MAG: hypothetical protein JJU00_07500 [Opitutales bacterium]|nr:hypothetical protein [Opitutales bacterium]